MPSHSCSIKSSRPSAEPWGWQIILKCEMGTPNLQQLLSTSCQEHYQSNLVHIQRCVDRPTSDYEIIHFVGLQRMP